MLRKFKFALKKTKSRSAPPSKKSVRKANSRSSSRSAPSTRNAQPLAHIRGHGRAALRPRSAKPRHSEPFILLRTKLPSPSSSLPVIDKQPLVLLQINSHLSAYQVTILCFPF